MAWFPSWLALTDAHIRFMHENHLVSIWWSEVVASSQILDVAPWAAASSMTFRTPRGAQH